MSNTQKTIAKELLIMAKEIIAGDVVIDTAMPRLKDILLKMMKQYAVVSFMYKKQDGKIRRVRMIPVALSLGYVKGKDVDDDYKEKKFLLESINCKETQMP